MRMILKICVLLGALGALGACSMPPKAPVEHTLTQSKLDPGLQFERITMADRQGVSNVKVTQQNGRTVNVDWSDETSTSEQDMANIAVGAAVGPLINQVGGAAREAAAHNRCKGSGCGSSSGHGGPPVYVQAISNSVSESLAQTYNTSCGRQYCLE